MKYLSIFASVLLATASAYGQSGESCRTASDPTLQKPELYAGYDCVNLLDSTAVTVQPTGSGSFTVCKIVKVMNTRGAVAQSHPQIRLRSADGTCRVSSCHHLQSQWRRNQPRYHPTAGLCRSCPRHLLGSTAIMMEIGRLDPGDTSIIRSTKKVSPMPC